MQLLQLVGVSLSVVLPCDRLHFTGPLVSSLKHVLVEGFDCRRMLSSVLLSGRIVQLRKNPFAYQDKPRLGTALALLKASSSIEERLDEVSQGSLLLTTLKKRTSPHSRNLSLHINPLKSHLNENLKLDRPLLRVFGPKYQPPSAPVRKPGWQIV